MHFTLSPLARRVGALALALIIPSVGLAIPARVAANGVTPTTTTLSGPDLNPKPIGYTSRFQAAVDSRYATGTMTFYDVTGGGKVELGAVTIAPDPFPFMTSSAFWSAPADLPVGTYLVQAEYSGDVTYAASDSAAVSLTVGPRPSVTQLTVVSGPHDSSGATAQKGDVLTISARVDDVSASIPVSGVINVKLDGATVGSLPTTWNSVEVPTAGWTIGSHVLSAEYDPGANTDHSASASPAWPINLLANTVDVSGVGVQYSTFYPYKDGYRDTVAIRGTRLERESVSVRVYSPTNRLVKSASVAAGTGAYSVAWNGRTSTGVMLASGTYKVVQVITDSLGARKTVTSYVALSSKRLYYTTVTLSRLGTQYAKKATYWRAYAFTLPSATVYKTLKFGVNGRTGVPPAMMGPQDFSKCSAATWSSGCVTRWTTLPWTRAWVNVYGSTTRDHSGRTARLYVYLDPSTGGTAWIYSARVIVTYGVLR